MILFLIFSTTGNSGYGTTCSAYMHRKGRQKAFSVRHTLSLGSALVPSPPGLVVGSRSTFGTALVLSPGLVVGSRGTFGTTLVLSPGLVVGATLDILGIGNDCSFSHVRKCKFHHGDLNELVLGAGRALAITAKVAPRKKSLFKSMMNDKKAG
jgi:hypothetical protein